MKKAKQAKEPKQKKSRNIPFARLFKAAALIILVAALITLEVPTLTVENAVWIASLATLILAIYEWIK